MKLDQVTMFKAVGDLGSLKRASERLHKTQPAISQGIRQLESSLGLELFNRAGYRLTLTDAGKIVYQRALRLLNEAAAMQQVAHHIASGNETSITLAIEASFDLKGILPLLENVQNQFAGTQIVLKQEYLTGAVEAMQTDNAILCVSPMELISPPAANIESHFLNAGTLMDVAAPRLLARHPNLKTSGELINEYQIVVQDSGTGSKDKDWGVQGGQRRWYVNDFSTKKMLIERGMGWGKIPGYYAQVSLAKGELVALNFTDKQNTLHLNYHVIKKRDQVLGPVARTLWEQFKAYTFYQPF